MKKIALVIALIVMCGVAEARQRISYNTAFGHYSETTY
jgi:hypothetical protein